VNGYVSDELKQYGGLAVGREEEQKQYFAQSRLYASQIESTDACHQGCIYCYAGSTSEEGYGISSAEIRGLLEDATALDIRAIDWLSGDPLLRRDWAELMARSLPGPGQQRLDQRPAAGRGGGRPPGLRANGGWLRLGPRRLRHAGDLREASPGRPDGERGHDRLWRGQPVGPGEVVG
jgi:hypothetical protein